MPRRPAKGNGRTKQEEKEDAAWSPPYLLATISDGCTLRWEWRNELLAMDSFFFYENGPLSVGRELDDNNRSGTISPVICTYSATVSVSYSSANR